MSNTDPTTSPLWRVLQAAQSTPGWISRQECAKQLRAIADEVVPDEPRPRAEFDCEPKVIFPGKPPRHDHSAFLRRQLLQEELDLTWKERMRIRERLLAEVGIAEAVE